MKSEITKRADKTSSYPCLKELNRGPVIIGRIIVLFYKEGDGIVVYAPTTYYKVGEHAQGCAEHRFDPFYGDVTLHG